MTRLEKDDILDTLRDGLEALLGVLEREVPARAERRVEECARDSLTTRAIEPAAEPDLAAVPDPEQARRDELYEEALVVVTDFGRASRDLLQMWLSIPASRARRILEQLEADGLITGYGRVLRKAHAARASFNPTTSR